MTLQVYFDQFAETVKRLLKQEEAYVAPHDFGSLITSAKPGNETVVAAVTTMKPKEAARIFEQLDLPVLLDVLERMKETKTSPILASMEPGKAKAVTLALAARHPALELKQ